MNILHYALQIWNLGRTQLGVGEIFYVQSVKFFFPPRFGYFIPCSKAKVLLILLSLPRPSLVPLVSRCIVLWLFWVYNMMAFSAHSLHFLQYFPVLCIVLSIPIWWFFFIWNVIFSLQNFYLITILWKQTGDAKWYLYYVNLWKMYFKV